MDPRFITTTMLFAAATIPIWAFLKYRTRRGSIYRRLISYGLPLASIFGIYWPTKFDHYLFITLLSYLLIVLLVFLIKPIRERQDSTRIARNDNTPDTQQRSSPPSSQPSVCARLESSALRRLRNDYNDDMSALRNVVDNVAANSHSHLVNIRGEINTQLEQHTKDMEAKLLFSNQQSSELIHSFTEELRQLNANIEQITEHSQQQSTASIQEISRSVTGEFQVFRNQLLDLIADLQRSSLILPKISFQDLESDHSHKKNPEY